MPAGGEPTPAQKAELTALRKKLRDEVPAKQLGRNILLATWNIREFGGLTETWQPGSHDVPKRNLFDLACITEIVSRFDVVAIQEIQGGLKALRHMMKLLGPNWAFVLTDVTLGAEDGQEERLGFVFDQRRVKLSGLAAELVLRPMIDADGKEQPAEQFKRTPYAVTFLSSGQTFMLVTLHVLFGDSDADRTAELQKIADWLAGWAGEIAEWGHNLIVEGDFNVTRRGDANFQALTSSGLRTPPEIEQFPSTIFKEVKHYDQIAWFTGDGGTSKLRLDYEGEAGYFDYTKCILTDVPTANAKSFRISDHFPLWVELRVPAP
jgi:endonuclease/exonuclease/phosphatase family metal-dependent hydrolase